MSYTDIAKALNNQNIKTKRGNKFNYRAISNIIKNPIYCGYLKWDSHIYKNNHTPIISVEEYNKSNKNLKKAISTIKSCKSGSDL